VARRYFSQAPQAPRTASLVCEGACNPDLRPLDSRLKAAAPGRACDRASPRCSTPLQPQEIAALHALVYTRHLWVRGDIWACGTCFTPRCWGGER